MAFDDENIDNDESEDVNELSISSTSTATGNAEMPRRHDNDRLITFIDNSNQNAKTSLKKYELIDQYFMKLDTGGYHCKLRNGEKNSNKVHKQVPYSDNNLRSHLARQHRLTQLLYRSQRLQHPVKSQVLSADVKKKFDDALIYAIVKDSRPFGDFRKAGFQHFLQVVLPNTNYKGPHRTIVRRRMATLYSVYCQALIDELSSVNDITLTADSWVSPRRMHFLCIAAHYYDKQSGYVSKVISFRRFIGRSLALRIRQFIRSELKKLKITEKICSITTDNGANIKLPTNIKEFGFRIPCLAHWLHLTVTNGLGLWKRKKSGDDSPDGETNGTWSPCRSDYEDTSPEASDEEELVIRQSQRNDYDEKEIEYSLMSNSKEFIYNLLQRTRTLITEIHRSSNLDKYVRDQIYSKQEVSNKHAREDNIEPVVYNELVMNFRVRWSSSFHILNRFSTVSSIINDVTFTAKSIDGVTSDLASKLFRLTFSHDDWNWISSLKFVLNRFEESTRLLSGRSYHRHLHLAGWY